jgi:hypothetical protein
MWPLHSVRIVGYPEVTHSESPYQNDANLLVGAMLPGRTHEKRRVIFVSTLIVFVELATTPPPQAICVRGACEGWGIGVKIRNQ